MRDVVKALERLNLTWYLTGSEALAAYGTPRQTLGGAADRSALALSPRPSFIALL